MMDGGWWITDAASLMMNERVCLVRADASKFCAIGNLSMRAQGTGRGHATMEFYHGFHGAAKPQPKHFNHGFHGFHG
jgi:hypothetical protein